MKEAELRKHAVCDICRQPIGHTGLPLFWRVTVERFGIDLRAVRRQDGLTAMLGGNAMIAQHMGANEDMAKSLMTVVLTVCESCAMEQSLTTTALLRAEAAEATEAGLRG